MYSKISTLVARDRTETLATQTSSERNAEFPVANLASGGPSAPLAHQQFRRMLCQERKRSERSRRRFLLMLVRYASGTARIDANVAPRVLRALATVIRDTDTLGWFESDVLGVIFTEIGEVEPDAAAKVIEAKIIAAIDGLLAPDVRKQIEIEFYAFPADRRVDGYRLPIDPELYPDLFDIEEGKKLSLFVKRVIDIAGALCALMLLSPMFLILAVLIKLTSKGPVFFRQERLGQFEVPFVFLKFRSMRVASNAEIHREYVKNFIAGRAEPQAPNGNGRRVYKITNDPRITWIGKFMRRTSLDELPQFWNVLTGQMSLVGPRPPIHYELDAYDIWHRRRLLEVKPGITGLWQVHGRSRTTFDEMVRLDLRYAKTWSLLVDLKILMQTPRAVVSGDGAY